MTRNQLAPRYQKFWACSLLLSSALLLSSCSRSSAADASVPQVPTASAIPGVVPPPPFTHTVKRGESLPGVMRQYIAHTSFMTGREFEAALREANHKPTGIGLKPGELLVIPGYESAPIVEHTLPVPRSFEAKAIYLTGIMAGSDNGIRLIRRWHDSGGNAVVFD